MRNGRWTVRPVRSEEHGTPAWRHISTAWISLRWLDGSGVEERKAGSRRERVSWSAESPPRVKMSRARSRTSGVMVGSVSIPRVTASMYIMEPPHMTA